MTYGTIKVDTVTFTDAGVDKSVTLSGLVQNPTFSGNVTVTGTLSGVTVTGTTANFTSGNFTNISGGTHTITSGVFAAGSAASPSITFTGDLNTGIYSPGADQVAISTGGSGRLFVDSNGNVGVKGSTVITTSAVSAPTFQIGDGVGSPAVVMYSATTGASQISFADSTTGTGSYDGYILYNQNSQYLEFGTAANPRLRITSAGLVGVGTSSPHTRLHVDATKNTTAAKITTSGALFNNDYTQLGFGAAADSSSDSTAIRSVFTNALTNLQSDLAFLTHTGSSLTEKVRITSGGSVGVGTTSPAANLHIQGTTGASLRIQAGSTSSAQIDLIPGGTSNPYYVYVDSSRNFIFQDNASERLRIDSSGRVGIGSSSPSNALTVQSTSRPQLHVSYNGNGGIYLTSANDVARTNWQIASSETTANTLQIYPSDSVGGTTFTTPAVTIDASRRVGIGTTTVSDRLHVGAGNITLSYADGSTGLRNKISWRTESPFFDETAYIAVSRTGVSGAPADIVLATGGAGTATEKARLTSDGKLLVGTSSSRSGWFNSSSWGNPTLQVEGTSVFNSGISVTNNSNDDNGSQIILGKSRATSVGSATLVSSGDNLGRISFQGADGSELVAAATIECNVDTTPGANDMPGRLVFSTTADGASSPTERMRIANNGAVTIGHSDQSAPNPAGCSFFQNGAAHIGNNAGAAGWGFLNFYRSTVFVGNISQNGTTGVSYNTASDYRLKENVTEVIDGITRLQQLKPSRFNFIAEPGKTVDGFLAHEAAEVVPECVTGEKDAVDDDGNPIYQGIDQSKLVPLLTAALQEAITKIESLAARLTAAGI